MRRLSVIRLAASVITAGIAFASQGASAREITDWEASKLTLDALTATPVYHRSVTTYTHRHSAAVHTVAAHHSVAPSRRALVHTVVYHAKAPVSSKHHARRHG